MAESTVVDLTEGSVRPLRSGEVTTKSRHLPIDSRGRVRVWQIEQGKWLNLHPVDAREQLNRGIVSLTETAAEADVETTAVPPSAHLETMTVKELEEYVDSNSIDVDLSIYRLKEEKIKAIRGALSA